MIPSTPQQQILIVSSLNNTAASHISEGHYKEAILTLRRALNSIHEIASHTGCDDDDETQSLMRQDELTKVGQRLHTRTMYEWPNQDLVYFTDPFRIPEKLQEELMELNEPPSLHLQAKATSRIIFNLGLAYFLQSERSQSPPSSPSKNSPPTKKRILLEKSACLYETGMRLFQDEPFVWSDDVVPVATWNNLKITRQRLEAPSPASPPCDGGSEKV